MKQRYKVIDLNIRFLAVLLEEAKVPQNVHPLEWWLNTHAPGRLVSTVVLRQIVPGSELSPQGPQAESALQMVFELPEVIQ